MTEKWRLLVTPPMDAASNMSMDESVLRHCGDTGTIRFYSWEPWAISIGYFQGMREEIDLDKCKELGVQYIRRITGGGAVFHHKELTYSIITREDNPKIPRNILDSYGTICQGLINGLASLGLEAKFHPINDIVVGGKKISGNAQTRRFRGVLQHGTLLADVDPELMFQLLLVPNEKIRDKMIQSVEERVTSVKHQLGRIPEWENMVQAMKEGFEKALDITLIPSQLTSEEQQTMERVRSERYATDEWLFKR